jgi:hypothetical protein
MANTVKITGTSITGDIEGNHRRDSEFEFELPLRDLFAAFALAAVIGLDLEEATHASDAFYAYAAADAMLEVRTDTTRKQPE